MYERELQTSAITGANHYPLHKSTHDKLRVETPRTALLIHWNEAEAGDRARWLEKAGFSPLILASSSNAPGALRRLLENPIDAIVIDLSRLPSHGRDIGLHLRGRKATRHIPIVFVDGEPEKVARTKTVLPDAAFADWPKIGTAIRTAIKSRPANPAVPNTMDGYSGTPLPKKLGIKPGVVITLIDAPDGFERMLDPLPDGVLIQGDVRGRADLAVLFAARMADLYEQFPRVERSLNSGGRLWVAWPKQASGVKTDITQSAVREFGLASGWVDFKICAIDATWSGLAFARRRS